MFRSLPQTSAAILLVAALSFAACDELEDEVLVGPSGDKFLTPTVNTLVIPATTLPFHVMPILGCPLAPPFRSHFSVVANPVGADWTLNEVGIQFVDTTGIISPLTFNQNELNAFFGSTVVVAGGSRTFSFQTDFGCNFQGSPHSLRGRAVFISGRGHRMERTFDGRFR
jgi:hypothetical protein